MKTSIQQNLARYMNSINRHFPDGAKSHRPKGGFSIWLRLAGNIHVSELHCHALQEGIGIFPGQIFATTSQYDNYIRIDYCIVWKTKIDRHLGKLAKLIRK
jgi:DNA-binding transcriptional MocR family regulator